MEKIFHNVTVPNNSNNWGTDLINGFGNPTIEFTFVPSYGTYNNLEGRIYHVRPVDYRIAVYIKVIGGWWTKPYWNNPLNIIWFDGTWSCDITTGGNDQKATEIKAFLVPVGYDPPSMSGGSILPSGLYENAITYITVTREP